MFVCSDFLVDYDAGNLFPFGKLNLKTPSFYLCLFVVGIQLDRRDSIPSYIRDSSVAVIMYDVASK